MQSAVYAERERCGCDNIAKYHLRTRILIIGGLSGLLWTLIFFGIGALIDLLA